MDYISGMYQVLRTEEFNTWITGLRDKVGQKQVLARLTRLSLGHWGDCKPVGGEVTELRIDTGPGYRVYCWRDGDVVVIALGGGDKSTQQRDITKAQAMVQSLKE
jgi:putative addiction module killer protein